MNEFSGYPSNFTLFAISCPVGASAQILQYSEARDAAPVGLAYTVVSEPAFMHSELYG
jgi:hypothetical protein